MKKIITPQALIGTICLNLVVMGIFFGPIWSCADFTDQYHFDVAPELRPHVRRFYAQAKSRGFNLPTNGLSASLVHIHSAEHSAGDSFTGSLVLVLDQDFVHREQATGYRVDSLRVEYVVFHELGHALLFRDHCGGVSIMNANNEHINAYSGNEIDRQGMIDELFGNYRP